MNEPFNWILSLILALLNIFSFSLTILDKYRAKTGGWRIPEKNLLLAALIFGAPGCLLAMLIARHKIRKPKFYILVPLLVLLQAWALFVLLNPLAAL